MGHNMSAECSIHGVDLLGYMDTAYCPVCRIAALESRLARLEEEKAQAAKELTEVKEQFQQHIMTHAEALSQVGIRLAHAEAREAAYAGFFGDFKTLLFRSGVEMDTETLMDAAVKWGLFRIEPYDPNTHGDDPHAETEPGDPWYVPCEPDAGRALADEVQALRKVVDAARPFLNLKDKGEYVLGVITQSDLTRLEDALAKLGEEGKTP